MRAHAAVMLAFALITTGACAGVNPRAGVAVAPRSLAAVTVPPLLIGRFADDYGSDHAVSAEEWLHQPRSRYHIVKWVTAQEYLIAYNDVANPSDGGRWTRIDWLRLPGVPPYEWGFCLSAYKAATAAEAEGTVIANRAAPRTGCSGFPFTRMKRVVAAPDAR